MSRDVTPVFADIDAFDPDAFVTHLTPDVVFRFGNADPVTGRDAVREAVAGFTHHIRNVWEFGDTTVVQIDVEYRRKDGKSVTVPNADILAFDGELVRDWQIYIDVAPVYPPFPHFSGRVSRAVLEGGCVSRRTRMRECRVGRAPEAGGVSSG